MSHYKKCTKMVKDRFILYCEQINALSELNDAQLGRLIRYLVQFLQKGTQPSKRESNALLVAFNMLKTVDMLSDTVSWESAGYCGKKQPMPVSMGGPAIRCRVNIGGR